MKNIRYEFIYRKVVQLYEMLDEIVFPLRPDIFLKQLENCRMLTYQEFAKINGCSVNDVISLCDSKSGCTHYEVDTGRYLVLINESPADNNVPGRIRWTKGHELGHVVAGHLPIAHEAHISENSLSNLSDPFLEREADFFASVLLCPMPLFPQLEIGSPQDIERVFGVSTQASKVRWSEYQKWQRNRRKTAWEGMLKALYAERGIG